MFITSGMRADWITLAVRTGGPGAAGISLIAVPGDAPGLTRTRAGQDGLVVQRHRAAALRRLPRAGATT